MFKEVSGPLAVLRECTLCKHHTIVKKGIRGVGRGYGLREGNKARGVMIQHFKTVHPEKYSEYKKDADRAFNDHR